MLPHYEQISGIKVSILEYNEAYFKHSTITLIKIYQIISIQWNYLITYSLYLYFSGVGRIRTIIFVSWWRFISHPVFYRIVFHFLELSHLTANIICFCYFLFILLIKIVNNRCPWSLFFSTAISKHFSNRFECSWISQRFFILSFSLLLHICTIGTSPASLSLRFFQNSLWYPWWSGIHLRWLSF